MISIEGLRQLYVAVGTRIGLGFAAIGAVVVSMPLADELRFDVSRAFTIITALALWLGAEITSYSREPHEHDKELRQRLRSLVAPRLNFLRDHDFGASFHRENIDFIHEISASWVGVTYSFQDRTIESIWANIRRSIVKLSQHIAYNSHSINEKDRLFTFKNDYDRSHGTTAQTLANMQLANELANQIYQLLEQLESLCIKRLGAYNQPYQDFN